MPDSAGELVRTDAELYWPVVELAWLGADPLPSDADDASMERSNSCIKALQLTC